MNWYDIIKACHLAVTDKVSHFDRLDKVRRQFVWQEDGAGGYRADNRQSESSVTGSTDLFTDQDYDPWCKQLEAQFNIAGVSWYKSLVQREGNGITHHEWQWEVPDTG